MGFFIAGGDMPDHEPLQKLRRQIQTIDAELVAILQRRIEVVLQIGQYKEDHRLPVRDKNRENEVIEQILSTPHDPMDSDALKNLFEFIMKICRDAQHALMEKSKNNNSGTS